MKKLFIAVAATMICVGAFAQGKLSFAINTDNLIYFSTDKAQLAAADANTQVAGFSLAGSGAYTGAGGTIAALAGSPSFDVTLLAGTSAGSLAPVMTTVIGNFGTEGQTLNPLNVTLASPTFPAGTAAYFQIQVYDASVANTAAAWAVGKYGGETAVFTAVPQASVYSPVYQRTSPVNSTWAPGTQVLVDYPGVTGGIALTVINPSGVPEPSTFALAGLGLASLLILRRRK